MMKRTIYLDYAAATPVDPAVLKLMQPYASQQFYNPSALYLASQNIAKVMDVARSSIAAHLGARPTEVIFTAGGTEANNLAIAGIMQQYPDSHMVVSSIEHDSVLNPARQYDHSEIKVQLNGRLNLEDLKQKITKQTVLVSVMYANNEIGTVQPIRDVAKIIAEIRKQREHQGIELPLYFHTDACQAANYLDLHVHRLGVDLMTLNGGKIYGPKQSGVLYKAAHVSLKPQILGGGQEFGLRSGTENVAHNVGFAGALDMAISKKDTEAERLKKLQQKFIDGLKHKWPQAIINGSLEHRLPNNVHVTLPGQDNERLLMQLDERGIMCATGSACSASNEEVSHVLHALGLSDEDAQSSLRFTMGRQTTVEDVESVVKMLTELLK